MIEGGCDLLHYVPVWALPWPVLSGVKFDFGHSCRSMTWMMWLRGLSTDGLRCCLKGFHGLVANISNGTLSSWCSVCVLNFVANMCFFLFAGNWWFSCCSLIDGKIIWFGLECVNWLFRVSRCGCVEMFALVNVYRWSIFISQIFDVCENILFARSF